MFRGFYTATSGLITQEKKLNTYANNIANATKAGYKKDDLIAGTFGEHMAVRMNNYQRRAESHDLEGQGVFMQVIDSKYTNHAQGSFESTERPLDMAVQGEGYFVIIGDNGEEYLTRDGQFAIDDEGYLVLPGFGRVQGEGGDITLERAEFVVETNGAIFLLPEEDDDDMEELDRLLLAVPDDYANMEKLANGMFFTENYTELEEDETVIRQGWIEKSNVDMSEEMTRIIASQRGLQSASQVVRMYDEMSKRSNDSLGTVR